MKEWIENQIEQWDTIALEKIDKETHRVNSLIDYYHWLMYKCTTECLPRHHSALIYEEEFKQELLSARKAITRKIAWTLLNQLT